MTAARPPAPVLARRPVADDRLATLLARSVQQRTLARAGETDAQNPLSNAQVKAAIKASKRFTPNAIRVIQLAVHTPADGVFGPKTAQAVARFQRAVPHPQDGIIDDGTLNAIVVVNRMSNINDETLELVADYYRMDTTSDVLSLRFDKDLAGRAAVTFQSGNLRVIRIGLEAFLTAETVRDAIDLALNEAIPAAGELAPVPALLTDGKARAAVAFNSKRLRDPRSVIAVQSLLKREPFGLWDVDTVQSVAKLQNDAHLEVDGKIGPQTMRAIGTRMLAGDDRDSLLRLIVDFYRLDENGLLDVYYEPTLDPRNANTHSTQTPGPSWVQFGPSAFAQGWEGLVHSVAHEFEHVRQRRVGISSDLVREFLGERIEILSKGMLQESFKGFVDDAWRAISIWAGSGHGERAVPGMTLEERRAHWKQFEELRDKVHERFEAASPAEQIEHMLVLWRYDAVEQP